MKLISAQSRFVVKSVLKRNYDHFTPAGKKKTDQLMLVLDVFLILALIFIF